MKTKLEKIMNWVYSNLLWVIIIAGISLYFISPIISTIGVGLIFVLALGFIILKHVNEPKKEQENKPEKQEKISEPPVTEWISLNKWDNKKYRLSIFYDEIYDYYRIVDMNNHTISGCFETEEEAKEQIKSESLEIVNVKVYNCV